MNGEYVRDDARELRTLERSLTDSRNRPVVGVGLNWKERLKRNVGICSQVLHFLISMGYLWAGVVEFIRNPPFFDAYGDATESIDLPQGFFKNDPRSTESGILRLMDLPILTILIVYQGVCIWLRYKGLSWLLTTSMSVTFLFFWIVNFWEKERFDWKNYSTRMNGLEIQVSSIALSGTMVFMVIFFKRQKFPFKFRSSLTNKHNSSLYILWNFFAIYLVMFSSLMIWFIKLYASWACFSSVKDIMQLCSTTNQVQCYPCSQCTSSALRKCVKDDKTEVFSCSSRLPSTVEKGAFCTFNFNMSVYGFLLTFAYIGGLCVFLSTFLRVAGHYVFRGFFLAYDIIYRLYYGSDDAKRRFGCASPWRRRDCELEDPCSNGNNNVEGDPVVYNSDSDEEGNVLINVSFD